MFHRADQALRFRAYARGLLEPGGRKNVEGIATAAGRVMMVEANLSQALQHFISHSPWDAGRLFAAVRRRSAHARRDPAAVLVVHDAVFPKKGRSSVGVQRQFARSLGKKLNCQLAVCVSQIGPRGYFPLSARLYLPGTWLKETAGAGGLPVEYRTPLSKADIALALLDELRAEGNIAAVTAEPAYLTMPEFGNGLATRGLTARTEQTEAVAAALSHLEWLKAELGFDHFEGRTWAGWHHHVAVVFAAHQFVAEERSATE